MPKYIPQVLAVALVVIGAYLALTYKVETQDVDLANIESSSDIDISKLAEAIKEVESEGVSDEEDPLTEEETYSNPYITHIRVALNNYLSGSTVGIEENALDNISDSEECGLNTFDKSYYKSKFIIYGAGRNDYGGVQADIIFLDNPDSIFWAWIYRYAGEEDEYVIRGFCRNGPPENKKEELRGIIDAMKKDGVEFSL